LAAPTWFLAFLKPRLAQLVSFILVFSGLSLSAQGTATVSLAWDSSQDPDVVGYFRYFGTSSGVYTNVEDVGPATSVAISGLLQGTTYYFSVSAYNSIGLQSLPSAELPYTVPLPTNSATAPSITSQPTNQSVLTGGSAAFQVIASGTAPLSYQWLFNDRPLPDATNNILALTNIQSGQAGAYNVVVKNSAGSVTSSLVSLTVLQPASISRVNFDGATLSVSFESVAGLVHLLEYTDSLTGNSWAPIMPALPGTGGILTLQDTSPAAPTRFYRVVSY
jgi:hypothetical protein